MYYVSRQTPWDSDPAPRYVEVAGGGLDHSSPGMLVPAYRHLGEGCEYADPREAVEAAIAIRDAWHKDSGKSVRVGMGHTHGGLCGIPTAPARDLRRRARAMYAALPKCDGCGDVMGERSYAANDWDGGLVYCSEYCAERAALADEEALGDLEAGYAEEDAILDGTY